MPSPLSAIFGGGDHAQSDDQHLGAHDGADLDQTVGVHEEAGGSWQDADGTSHQWSSDHDVSLTVSAHALVATAIDAGETTAGGDL